MSDLLAERERDWDSNVPIPNAAPSSGGNRSRGSSHTALSTAADVLTGSFDEAQEPNQSATSRES